jgi:hypothetical protein
LGRIGHDLTATGAVVVILILHSYMKS